MSDTDTNGVSRRSILAGLGLGAGMAGLTGVSQANAATLPEPETSEDYDVVVIGSGLAGCAAALEAASSGARVAVLEKSSQARMGGNSLLALGTFTLPEDDSDEAQAIYEEEFNAYAQGRGNPALVALQAANVRGDIAWLESHGIEVLPQQPRPPTRVWNRIVGPAPYAGMMRLFRSMRELITEAGGVFAFDTKARQLIMGAGGEVVGVRAVGRNGVVDYRGRAVVIATGGYSGNTSMLEAYSDPSAGGIMTRSVAWSTGDGLALAQAAGAGLKGMGGLMALHIAAVDPTEPAAGGPSWAVAHSLSINREGKRFVDESLGYVAHGKAVVSQPQQTTSLVFDDTIRQLSAVESVIATFNRLGLTIHQADTLQELAQQIGTPVEPFVETITTFNAAIRDDQTAPDAAPPKAALARPIATPPFYAFSPLVPGITLSFGGIMINEKAQVLEADGRVIPGLYAAGEGAGHVYFDDYIGGAALTNSLVMGRIAGREAAA